MIAVANGVCWVAVHSTPVEWHAGPKIDLLVRIFPNRHNGYLALLAALASTQAHLTLARWRFPLPTTS